MKLIYDMRILSGTMHGMARYGLELLTAILETGAEVQAGVLVQRPEHAAALPSDPRVVAIACGLAPYGASSQVNMPLFLRKLRPEVYHCPFYAAPAFTGAPMVLTIHDLIHLRFPKQHGPRHRLFYRLVVGPAARRARAVFTVSQHSKRDLTRLLRVPESKIIVTPNGVGPAFGPLAASERPAAARALDLPEGYILGVGNEKPHKNLGGLIEAHRLLAGLLPGGVVAPPLVLVGVRPGFAPGAEPGPGLVFRESLGDVDLARAYAAATAVAVPSLYEGFGLPALEALACGAPLVASNAASLPEVVGEAGLLCDPAPEALARALARVLSEPDLAEGLRAAGPKQAARFSWAETARKTLAVYEQVARGVLA